jgi:hypothetical protein
MPTTDDRPLSNLGLYMRVTAALAETVRAAGDEGTPEGPLYAALPGKVTLAGFNACVDTLINAGLVERQGGNVLVWCGPEVAS